MSRWRQVAVNKIRVILLVPGMELEDQVTAAIDPIIGIAMHVLGECADSQQLLIPAAACPYISHGNQSLRPNVCCLLPCFFHLFSMRTGSTSSVTRLNCAS